MAAVTGGNSGIGLAAAQEFKALEDAVHAIGKGTLAVHVQGDVTHFAGLREECLHPFLSKHRIHNVPGQYHSALEHTLLWIVNADDPYLIEEFALDSGLASFNKLTIVPLKSLDEWVIPRVKKVHDV